MHFQCPNYFSLPTTCLHLIPAGGFIHEIRLPELHYDSPSHAANHHLVLADSHVRLDAWNDFAGNNFMISDVICLVLFPKLGYGWLWHTFVEQMIIPSHAASSTMIPVLLL